MTGPADDVAAPDRDPGAEPAGDGPVCAESGCERRAAVRLHVPWAENRVVCPPHARVLARPDGVVAEPLEGTETEWP